MSSDYEFQILDPLPVPHGWRQYYQYMDEPSQAAPQPVILFALPDAPGLPSEVVQGVLRVSMVIDINRVGPQTQRSREFIRELNQQFAVQARTMAEQLTEQFTEELRHLDRPFAQRVTSVVLSPQQLEAVENDPNGVIERSRAARAQQRARQAEQRSHNQQPQQNPVAPGSLRSLRF